MKSILAIPALIFSMVSATTLSAQAQFSAEDRTCQPFLALITPTDQNLNLTYDTREFRKIYQEIVAQARAAGKRSPSENEVRLAIAGIAKSKLNSVFPGDIPNYLKITINCRSLWPIDCTITILL